nr:hypothetical protein [Tanacetum cinerariifolium]
MILESIENASLIWPTVEENGVTRTKKYAELFDAEKIQADCDMKATNIILQGLPDDIYSLVNHYKVAKDLCKEESLHKYYLRFTQLINDMNIYNMKMEQFQVNTKFLNSLPPEWRNNASGHAKVVKCYNCQGEGHMARQCTQPKRPRNAAWYKDKAMLAEAQEAGKISNEKQLAFLADPGVPDDQAFSWPTFPTMVLTLSKRIEAPKELPKVSLVNESLKQLKLHHANFDKVVKIKTTPNAQTEGEWGFEHTKVVFNNEIVPFLKSLKDSFNVFDKDLLNEIMEVQTIFDQMDAAVQQSSVDKQLNMERKQNESCDKCFNLDAELLKSQNVHNNLLKRMFKLDLDHLAPKLLQNREAHIDYLKYTQEQADILRGIVKQAKAKQPLDNALDFA